jgi:hypothetical protein
LVRNLEYCPSVINSVILNTINPNNLPQNKNYTMWILPKTFCLEVGLLIYNSGYCGSNLLGALESNLPNMAWNSILYNIKIKIKFIFI